MSAFPDMGQLPAAAQVLDHVADGVVYGSILALCAVGLTLVYGILRLSNFAHGDLVAFGAFMSFLFGVRMLADVGTWGFAAGATLVIVPVADAAFVRRLRPDERIVLGAFGALLIGAALWTMVRVGAGTTNPALVTATLLAIAVTVALLAALELAVWRPLRRKRATLLTLIIVSIGVSLVVRNALQLAFGGGLRSFDRPIPESDILLGAHVSDAQQLSLVAAVALVGFVHLFLTRTQTGRAMRALRDDADLARACGIDVDRTVLHVWVVSGALVAVGGVLFALVQNNTMNVNMGLTLLLPLFASVILGGIGNPYGAVLGALVVGVGMKTSALWIGTEYELAAALILLVATLLVRPQGILGGGA